MDVVAIPLEKAKARLDALGIHYTVETTRPYGRSFAAGELYVIRQLQQPDGTVCLLTAAKMRKEVF